jgi:hypothetical protein
MVQIRMALRRIPIGKHEKSKQHPLPGRLQKQLAGYKACNEKHKGRMNATAFGRDLQPHPGEVKQEPLAENRHSGQSEQGLRRRRRSLLKKAFDPID